MDDTAYTPTDSYVNTYVPPTDHSSVAAPSMASTPPAQASTPVTQTPPMRPLTAASSAPVSSLTNSQPHMTAQIVPPPQAKKDDADWTPPPLPSSMQKPLRPQDAVTEPDVQTDMEMPSVSQSAPSSAPQTQSSSQALEDQNIFELLGVTQATDSEKEAFLDELQQVIWEDFVENDVQLLLTETEVVELGKIQAKIFKDELEKQEAMVVYLEKLIPDLEEVMLEKALELKRDMTMERIAGMKEYYADVPQKLDAIGRAENQISQNKWRDAAQTLNAIAA